MTTGKTDLATQGGRGKHRSRMDRLLGLILVSLPFLGAPAIAAPIVDSLPVTFTVQNVNKSNVPCLVDRKTYQIKGHLVGPRDVLQSATPSALTVYLHGIGWGEFYWHFTADPKLDYASQMGALGHVSLVYDQLGYGDSGRPLGLLNCYGGEADIARQIIDDLRSGDYIVAGDPVPPRFTKVALASQQVAALMTQPEAVTFRNIDALIVTSWADNPLAFRPVFLLQAAPFFASCLLGAQRSDGATGPRFYQFFPVRDEAFRDLSFSNADAMTIDQAAALRDRASCGEALSAVPAIGVDALQILFRKIRVPVLLVNGLEDKFFVQPLGANLQRVLYKGSSDVSSEFVANAGQALALERNASDFRTIMHNWLLVRGF